MKSGRRSRNRGTSNRRNRNRNRNRGTTHRYRKRRFHNSNNNKSRKFRQSGGDMLNYLPSDLSMAARSAAHSVGSIFSGTKGFSTADSPLPFNDHHLQKAVVAPSNVLPDLDKYFKDANALIPAI
jgi:hypothetical protein